MTLDLLDPSEARLTEAGARHFQASARQISQAVNEFLQGKSDVVDLALICLLAEGHLLLEDVPGVGKTSLARSLAAALGTPWHRIQFTPDLLPGDVTGVSVFHQNDNRFVFHPGPIFANVVLADEVNRASPRTQSALLEVMDERQVTVDGFSHPVPRPFLVIATQNPVDMDGTYPLPEAQLDRFLLKTDVGYPDASAELRILKNDQSARPLGVPDVARVSSAENIQELIALARGVHVAEAVLEYIVRIVDATRHTDMLRLGVSPRGALGLLKASRVRAALDGRRYVVPSDVQALVRPVLGHRVLAVPSVGATPRSGADVVAALVEGVQAPPLSATR